MMEESPSHWRPGIASHREPRFFPILTRRINMTQLLAASKNFVRDEEGASLVEYGLLLALIAVVCIAAVTTLGTSISTMLNSLAGKI
jgi:pilus assembly protein Flp/PilA